MQSLLLLGLAALAAAQNSTTAAITSAASLSSSSSAPASTSASSLSSVIASSAKAPAITVAQDGSGQFTAINPAISYAQNSGYPTVTILSGTYTEAISVVATQAVTIVGANPSPNDYSQNGVTVSNATPLTISSNNVQGISWHNLNFVSTAAAVSLRGTRNAFYECSFVSSGSGVITSSLGIALMYNSEYIDISDSLSLSEKYADPFAQATSKERTSCSTTSHQSTSTAQPLLLPAAVR